MANQNNKLEKIVSLLNPLLDDLTRIKPKHSEFDFLDLEHEVLWAEFLVTYTEDELEAFYEWIPTEYTKVYKLIAGFAKDVFLTADHRLIPNAVRLLKKAGFQLTGVRDISGQYVLVGIVTDYGVIYFHEDDRAVTPIARYYETRIRDDFEEDDLDDEEFFDNVTTNFISDFFDKLIRAFAPARN